MNSILSKLDVQDHDDAVELWYGIITNDASAVDDDVFVTLPELDPAKNLGPCYWNPVAGQLPTTGMRALVCFDNRRNPWIIMYGPLDFAGVSQITSSDHTITITNSHGPIVDLSV